MSDNFEAVFATVIGIDLAHRVDRKQGTHWTGGARGIGELRGEKFRLESACFPDFDIAKLTAEEARLVWHEKWLELGCDELTNETAAAVFEAYVEQGEAAARRLIPSKPRRRRVGAEV